MRPSLHLRPIQFVDTPVGRDGEVARLAGGMLWFAAISLRIMLAPRYVVRVRRLFRYTIVAYAASVIAPARAGEVARVWLLKQRHGIPMADSAAAAVGQKIIDGITMLLFVSPIPLLLPGVPGWIGRAIAIGVIARTEPGRDDIVTTRSAKNTASSI